MKLMITMFIIFSHLDGTVSEILSYANMIVISNKECGKSFDVTNNMLCATSKTQGVCKGDSGK